MQYPAISDPLVEILDQDGNNLKPTEEDQFIFGLHCPHALQDNPKDPDADFGTKELALRAAQKIREKIHTELGQEVTIPVVINTLPRRRVDVNRKKEYAIKTPYRDPEHNEYRNTLSEAFDESDTKTRKILAKIDQGIQLHSMSPETPKHLKHLQAFWKRAKKLKRIRIIPEVFKQQLNELFEALHFYVWTLPGGETRNTNFFTTQTCTDEELSNTTLNEALETVFAQNEIPIEKDHAYTFDYTVLALEYTKLWPGKWSFVDIVKTLIAKGSQEEVIRNLHQLEIDEEKLEKMAEMLSEAAMISIRTRLQVAKQSKSKSRAPLSEALFRHVGRLLSRIPYFENINPFEPQENE